MSQEHVAWAIVLVLVVVAACRRCHRPSPSARSPSLRRAPLDRVLCLVYAYYSLAHPACCTPTPPSRLWLPAKSLANALIYAAVVLSLNPVRRPSAQSTSAPARRPRTERPGPCQRVKTPSPTQLIPVPCLACRPSSICVCLKLSSACVPSNSTADVSCARVCLLLLRPGGLVHC